MKLTAKLILGILALVAAWTVGLFSHRLSLQDDAVSALGQLGHNTMAPMLDYYHKSGQYPKTLNELPIDTVHADGGTPDDLKHAVYINQGPLAIIILQRPGFCVLLEFHDGNCTSTRFLGTDPLQ